MKHQRWLPRFAAPLVFLMPAVGSAGGVGFSGNTLPNGPFWARPDQDCTALTFSLANDVAYQFQRFTVDVAGDYQIGSIQSYDGYLHLFENAFDPGAPTENCIAGNDDGSGFGTSHLQASLNPGTEYVVVTSAHADGEFGFFENSIAGPGTVLLGAGGGDPLAFDPAQRQALEALYNATDGENWLIPDDWLGPPETECGWSGLVCGDVGGVAGVIHLDLRFVDMNGPLPDSFPVLADLRVLRLSGNPGLTGDLANLGPLPALEMLELGDNGFTGDFGAFLSNVLTRPALTDLFLLELPAISPIDFPSGLGASKLFFLGLDGRNFAPGPFPVALTGFDELTFLSLANFQFSQPLPAAVGDFAALAHLAIVASTVPGPLPPELADIAHLITLTMFGNGGLSGGIPAELGQAGTLEVIDLSFNDLGGEIPSSVGNLSRLQILDLNDNRLVGEVPRSLGRLGDLRILQLHNNPDLGGFIAAPLVALERRGPLGISTFNTQVRRAGLFSRLGGLWYDPARDGSGFNFVALADRLVATFYGYGADGQTLWLISEPFEAPQVAGEALTDIVMLEGGDGSGRLDAPQPPATLVEWGRMSVTMDACERARATLDGADGRVTLELQQLVANEDTLCTLDAVAQKDRAASSALGPDHARLLERYRSLKTLLHAGAPVRSAELAEVMRQLYLVRSGRLKPEWLPRPRR